MERCKACRRSLTNSVSKKYGYGPDCLKRAVEKGNAPLESLEELKEFRRSKKGSSRNAVMAEPVRCEKTLDLFEQAKEGAIRLLKASVAECESYGLKINYTIEVSA